MNARAIRAALRPDYLNNPVLMLCQVCLIAIGSLFWIWARQSEEAFEVGLYGEFALSFPAEAWAAVMMAAAAVCWVGLRHPIKRWMVCFGAGLQFVQFMALGYSAIFTGGAPIIGLFATTFFCPLCAWMVAEALRDGALG